MFHYLCEKNNGQVKIPDAKGVTRKNLLKCLKKIQIIYNKIQKGRYMESIF
jgi:hypothetical protein